MADKPTQVRSLLRELMHTNGTLWLIIFVATDVIKTLIHYKELLEAGKPILWPDWGIGFFSMVLAGATGIRLYRDQSFARWQASRKEGEKQSETEFFRQTQGDPPPPIK